MRLHQYWHDGSPPDDVAGWIEGFRDANPDLVHRLYDEGLAARFISVSCGPREARAFESCGSPAMQADYARLCLLHRLGGLYLDADQQPLRPLASLLDQAPEALAPIWCGGLIGTGVLMSRHPGNAFLQACLELATDNLLQRRFENVLMTAGPGVFNAMFAVLAPERGLATLYLADCAWKALGWNELLALAAKAAQAIPGAEDACRRLTLLDTGAVEEWVGARPAAYKATDRHWSRATAPIYRGAPPAPAP